MINREHSAIEDEHMPIRQAVSLLAALGISVCSAAPLRFAFYSNQFTIEQLHQIVLPYWLTFI